MVWRNGQLLTDLIHRQPEERERGGKGKKGCIIKEHLFMKVNQAQLLKTSESFEGLVGEIITPIQPEIKLFELWW